MCRAVFGWSHSPVRKSYHHHLDLDVPAWFGCDADLPFKNCWNSRDNDKNTTNTKREACMIVDSYARNLYIQPSAAFPMQPCHLLFQPSDNLTQWKRLDMAGWDWKYSHTELCRVNTDTLMLFHSQCCFSFISVLFSGFWVWSQSGLWRAVWSGPETQHCFITMGHHEPQGVKVWVYRI